jgi:hypothetical protein
MTVKRWERGLFGIGALLACVFVVSNVWGLGVALLCADALWLLTRVQIVETPGGPGRYATLRGRLGLIRLTLILLIYLAVIYGIYLVHHDLNARARVALVAYSALVGLAFMLSGEFQRGSDDVRNWFAGARAERNVGMPLNQFTDRGWLVLHGYKKDRGGDIDHILCGPNGGYVIETKSHGFRRRDVGQTAGNAWWLREKLGVPWVTGVLCVAGDHPPERRDRIWVVGANVLVPWLKTQRNQPVDVQSARALLLGESRLDAA